VILDDLGVPYALGGSVASSVFGEPRATADVDIAIRVEPEAGEALVGRMQAEFYVPVEAARQAIRDSQSFNLLDFDEAFKVDFFVLGDGVLDRCQLERRVLVPIPGAPGGVWVTSAEDQILRKLDWYRQGGSVSDRQWRDVIGLLRIRGDTLDFDYLGETAAQVDLGALVEAAVDEAASAS
jgi:hypothetical protein